MLTPAELDAVFLQKRAHIALPDTLTALLHRTIACLFWYHYLVWWIERQLIRERELACDQKFLAAGVARESYSAAILNPTDTAPALSIQAFPRAISNDEWRPSCSTPPQQVPPAGAW